MLYKAAGAGKTFVIEPVEFRRKLAEQIGVSAAIDPGSEDAGSSHQERHRNWRGRRCGRHRLGARRVASPPYAAADGSFYSG